MALGDAGWVHLPDQVNGKPLSHRLSALGEKFGKHEKILGHFYPPLPASQQFYTGINPDLHPLQR